MEFDVLKEGKTFLKQLACPLTGTYQIKNLLTTIAVLDQLREDCGYRISDKNILDGIRNVVCNTQLMGRWQVLSKKPYTICDTGHNVEGVKEILNRLDTLQYKRLHFVLGMVNDKDIAKVLSLLPKNAWYYFCKADIPRGLDAKLLSEKAKEAGLKGKIYSSVREALAAAQENCKAQELVFVGGSTFVVAEVV